MNYTKWFDALTMADVPSVGGKNASLGQMIAGLKNKGILIPNGFAITSDAYWYYLRANHFEEKVKRLLNGIRPGNIQSLQSGGKKIRDLLVSGKIPADLAQEITTCYAQLCTQYNAPECDVAVRSSATAEDLPGASFAGQQETFLNIRGDTELLHACKKSIASLFTDRSISYRVEKHFDHFAVGLSIGVQKMIRSDKACSGVAFTLDTQTGFKDVISIDSSYGLGETIVQGLVTPDEFAVFTPKLKEGFKAIIKKKLGEKKIKLIYTHSGSKSTKQVAVPLKEQRTFSLTDQEIIALAGMVNTIGDYYSELNKKWMPMDVEWAKDGFDKKIYIVQARPETVHSQEKVGLYKIYSLTHAAPKEIIVSGQSIGQHIVSGIARVVKNSRQLSQVKKGEILVAPMTDPDWVPVMSRVAGIITDLGGRTCHAAIVSRELNTPALVGTGDATKKIKNGQRVTIDCSAGAQGFVYRGAIPFKQETVEVGELPKAPVDLLVNIANPDNAFAVSALPVDGVGLTRIEFIIGTTIQVHPMAIIEPKKVVDKNARKKIADLACAYASPKQYYIDTLAQGIGMIAAAFYPREILVRLSDFKTNEYRNLVGGSYFEQEEANPMIGFRGAYRYTHELYQDAFDLECAALSKVREGMGFDNVMIMVPFVRTPQEGQGVIDALADAGLKRGGSGLKVIMMCEIPSNVILIDDFSGIFDGFSIGSNDLTQFILGVDRDSGLLAHVFDERNEAVKKMIVMAIEGAHRNKKRIGICGQAPSDYPEFADFLIENKIDSISLNPDSVLPFLLRFKK